MPLIEIKCALYISNTTTTQILYENIKLKIYIETRASVLIIKIT